MVNPFFKNTGPHNINFLLKTVNLNNYNLPDDQISDIKDLLNSNESNLESLSLIYTEKHPKIIQAKNQNESLENSVFILTIFSISIFIFSIIFIFYTLVYIIIIL